MLPHTPVLRKAGRLGHSAPACIIRGISNAKRAAQPFPALESAAAGNERHLQQAERRIRSLFTYHPDAIFELDADGRYVDLNPACERLSGVPREALLGKPMGDRTSNPQLAKRSLQTTLSGLPVTFETTLINPDGRQVPVQATFVPIVVDARTVGVFGITKDVADWKRVEHMLAVHARQQTAVADLGLLALTDIDPDALLKTAVEVVGSLLNVEFVAVLEFLPESRAFQLLQGSQVPESLIEVSTPNARLESLLGCAECVRINAHESELPETSIGLATGVPGREHAHGVLLAWGRDPRWFSDDDLTFLKEVANVLGAAIDNNKATAELRRRESELKVLVETTSDNIVRFDSELRYMYVNPAVERMLNKPASALIGQSMPKLAAELPQVGIWERALRRVFRSGEEDELEARFGDRYFQVRLSPEFGPDGEVKSVLGVGRDVTANQQRQAERAQLYQELLERDSRLHQLVERVLLHQEQPKRNLVGAADQFNIRERQILRLLARGLTNGQIAQEVNLRPSTVKNYVASMLPRLNATDRTHAAVLAAQLGLLDGEAAD
jgi:PAS domain S-box-containing protein